MTKRVLQVPRERWEKAGEVAAMQLCSCMDAGDSKTALRVGLHALGFEVEVVK